MQEERTAAISLANKVVESLKLHAVQVNILTGRIYVSSSGSHLFIFFNVFFFIHSWIYIYRLASLKEWSPFSSFQYFKALLCSRFVETMRCVAKLASLLFFSLKTYIIFLQVYFDEFQTPITPKHYRVVLAPDIKITCWRKNLQMRHIQKMGLPYLEYKVMVPKTCKQFKLNRYILLSVTATSFWMSTLAV